eukprot:g7102.t1
MAQVQGRNSNDGLLTAKRGVSVIQTGNAVSKKAAYEEALKQKEFRARQGSIGGDMDNIDKYNKNRVEEDVDFRTGKKWWRNSRGSLVEDVQDRASQLLDRSIFREGFVLPQFLRNLFGITMPSRGSSLSLGSSSSFSIGPASVRSSGGLPRDSRTTLGSDFDGNEGLDTEALTFFFKLFLLPAFLLAELIEAPFAFVQTYPLLTFAGVLLVGAFGADKITEHALVPYTAVFGPHYEPGWLSPESSTWGTPGVFSGPALPTLNPLQFAYPNFGTDAVSAGSNAVVPWSNPNRSRPAFAASDYDDKGFLDFSGPNSVTDIMFGWIWEREMRIAARTARWLAMGNP